LTTNRKKILRPGQKDDEDSVAAGEGQNEVNPFPQDEDSE